MIAPRDRLLRALAVLEERGDASATYCQMEYEPERYSYFGERPEHHGSFPRRRMKIDIVVDGSVDDVQFPTHEQALLSAMRAVLPQGKTLTDDELYENAATWFAERMHRPNRPTKDGK